MKLKRVRVGISPLCLCVRSEALSIVNLDGSDDIVNGVIDYLVERSSIPELIKLRVSPTHERRQRKTVLPAPASSPTQEQVRLGLAS